MANDFCHVHAVEWARAPDTASLMMSLSTRRNLEALFRSVLDEDGSAAGDTARLDFARFARLVDSLREEGEDAEDVQLLYDKVRGPHATVGLQEFLNWVHAADDSLSQRLEERTDASAYASVVRAFTTMTRPLAQSAGAAVSFVTRSIGDVLARYLANPVRLFKRNAVGMFELLARRRGSLSAMRAIQAEVSSGGYYSIARLTAGPYLCNALVSFAMFQTYSRVKATLEEQEKPWTHRYNHANPYVQSMARETCAGTCAGVLQACMNTPLYNIKRRAPGLAITDGAANLFVKAGARGLFADLPLMMMQESIGLTTFFSSYELSKMYLEAKVKEEERVLAWIAAGMIAGASLTTVTLPFDNLHEWHILHRRRNTPRNALWHFCSRKISKGHPSTRRILFRGLTTRMPLGMAGGLPLIVYEVCPVDDCCGGTRVSKGRKRKP